jgi:hypothetical protein
MLREKQGKQGGLLLISVYIQSRAKFIRSAAMAVAPLTKIHGLSPGEGNMRRNT